MEKQTFEIPKGCSKVTVERVGNTIVTTFDSEKYIPKVWDCVKAMADKNSIAEDCIGEVIGIGNYIDLAYFINKDKKILYGTSLTPNKYIFTKITPEELQAEFNKLGYEYNFETHTAKKIRWKPDYGQKYYSVLSDCTIDNDIWHNDDTDHSRFKIGNCYRTQEEAEPRRQHYLSFKD